MLREEKRQELIERCKYLIGGAAEDDILIAQIALDHLQQHEEVTYEPDMQQLTPEHIETIRKASPASSLPDENFTNELFPAQDGWIEWKGGECPVLPIQVVDIKFRAGGVMTGEAGGWSWTNDQKLYDIIAYRVIRSEE